MGLRRDSPYSKIYVSDIVEKDQVSLRLDDAGNGVSYVGIAYIGSLETATVWQIKKITEVSGNISILFADGNSAFDNVWTNRLTLYYS